VTTSANPRPVLAIELSQRSGGVALIGRDDVAREIAVAGGRRDHDELAPAIAGLLEDAGLSAGSIATVAVDNGPGGFTGLRISVAIGQAIAEAAGARVVAVPGALVAAASTPELASMVGRVLVLSAAKAGTAWGTIVTRTDPDSSWSIVGTPGILSGPPADEPGAVLADEHLDARFRAAIPEGVPIIEPQFSPTALARIGVAAVDRREGGEGCGSGPVIHEDPARLQPLYPREPEAVRVWRARHPDNRSDGPVVRPG